ncbi:DUF6215 domain-containing protein [Streptomyces humi]|uniref:DUF6215 domain-containing protein n=1 Tax=Streptomyces humi TaxID=1428620 RepID=UPI0006288CDF|nr:DUF6215 domain-containing protein [Streptomyces humi]
MSEGFGEPEKHGRPVLQALAAVALLAVVVGALWAQKQFVHQKDTSGEPATCTTSHDRLPARYVSGARLCALLNRPDLPALLGTPHERIETASGNGDWITLSGGTKIPSPDATVTLETYSVKLSAAYDDLRVAETGDLLAGTRRTKVLGHPAVVYSSPTFSIGFDLGGGKATSGPGGTARCVLVSQHAKDDGKGAFEVALWRQDDVLPDDTALLRVAERVLRTAPGWDEG